MLAVMEEQYRERRASNSNTCLVCGRQGGNNILVTSVHSFVSASGTPLSDFLVKVVGEDPCYSVSEVICQQCFVLLDRLDAYQARAAEIHTHVTTRYRDTKIELMGQRQRMSELIASSLANVQELRHGTTLNVSDELTITVVHETLPKRRKLYHLQNGASFPRFGAKVKANTNNTSRSVSLRNDSYSQLFSNKFKRKKVPDASSDMQFLGTKKRKSLLNGSLSLNNNSILNNNNNISTFSSNIGFAKTGIGVVPSKGNSQREESKASRKVSPQPVSEPGDSSSDEDFSDASSSTDKEEEEEEEKDGEDQNENEGGEEDEEEENEVEDEKGSEVTEKDDEEKEQEEESSDDSSSDSDDKEEGSVSDEEENGDAQSQVEGEQKEEEQEEHEIEEEEEEPASGGDECDTPSQRAESSMSQASQDPEPVPATRPKTKIQKRSPPLVAVKTEEKTDCDIQPQPTEEDENVGPRVAEAMLMQSPLATSLLQSFLATSLWFGSPETSQKGKSGASAKQKQQQQVPDEVTRETLAVAVGATTDKKKRQELKNTGQCYINTKGKLVDAKRVWPQDCSRCPLKCNARISEEDRQNIFAEYWGLADYNLQREYLAAHMQREEKLGPSGLPRTVVLYFLTKEKGKKLQVCRQFFLKTLDVSEKASRIVLEKMVRGELGSEGGAATPPLGNSRPHIPQEDGDTSKDNTNDAAQVKMEDNPEIKVEEEDAKSEDSS